MRLLNTTIEFLLIHVWYIAAVVGFLFATFDMLLKNRRDISALKFHEAFIGGAGAGYFVVLLGVALDVSVNKGSGSAEVHTFIGSSDKLGLTIFIGALAIGLSYFRSSPYDVNWVKSLQVNLRALGFYKSAAGPDGVPGKRTAEAIRNMYNVVLSGNYLSEGSVVKLPNWIEHRLQNDKKIILVTTPTALFVSSHLLSSESANCPKCRDRFHSPPPQPKPPENPFSRKLENSPDENANKSNKQSGQ